MRDGVIAEVNRKKPRPMHSKSLAFEAGYARFFSDVLARGIQSVEREETETAKYLMFARCQRLVMTKATGLIHMECLEGPYEGDGVPAWVAGTLPPLKFWESSASLRSMIVSAWAQRIKRFLPSAKDCYPDYPEKSQWVRSDPDGHLEEYKTSASGEWSLYVDLAARRRVAGEVNSMAAVRTAVLGLWKFLTQADILNVCMATFGRRATIKDYNLTVKRRTELGARVAETPNLAVLIGAYIAANPRLRNGRNRIPSDVLPLARDWFFGPGFSPAAWRYVANSSRIFVQTLVEAGTSRFRDQVAPLSNGDIINLLAATGDQHPLAFVEWLLANMPSIGRESLLSNYDSLQRFIRLAGREAIVAKRQKRLRKFVRGDLVLAWDWLLGNEPSGCMGTVVHKVHKNATWASVMRTQQAWHLGWAERERRAREADAVRYQRWLDEQAAACWDSAIEAIDIGDVTATPLTKGRELIDEHVRMDHCVDQYIDLCVQGGSRIFRLASAGEEATVELVSTDKKRWGIRQVFGHGNAASSSKMWKAAKELVAKYTQASQGLAAIE